VFVVSEPGEEVGRCSESLIRPLSVMVFAVLCSSDEVCGEGSARRNESSMELLGVMFVCSSFHCR
jgi:hypothetical protein